MTREELLNCLVDRPCSACKYHKENGCSKWNCVFEEPIDEAENKGEWISVATGNAIQLKDGYTTESVKCSVCDEWLTASDEYACCGSFCPNCGADMRGEK